MLNVKRDFGALGDGVSDDTGALQAGFAASSNRDRDAGTRILFLPNGTYRVTNTLVVRTGVGPWVYGESRDGVVIRLADGVPTNVTAVLRTHPSDTDASSADFFMRNLRNLTIDVGGNPHADGVRWYGNNSSLLKNVRVLGTGRVAINSGFLGQSGPNLIQDALVEGDSDTGLVRNLGGRLWALGVKHEGRGVRFLTDQGGQTEILGLFNYAPDMADTDRRRAFDIRGADWSAAGVREISFGNTYMVKVREARGAEVRTEQGGGWIGWALYRSGIPAGVPPPDAR